MSSDENFLPGLDTLRACAILMVIPRHAREILSGDFFGATLKSIFNMGWIGVELFFVLSGFLITSQLLKALRKEGRVDFKKFYFKRSLRILPSYYCVLLVYYFWPAFREHPELDSPWKFAFFTMNYGRSGEAFSHAWSLCIEEHFYLILPSLIALGVWTTWKIKAEFLLAGALIGGIALRHYLWSIDAPFYPAVYRPTHTHMDGLLVGVMIAVLRQKRVSLWSKIIKWPSGWLTIGLIALTLGLSSGHTERFGYVWSFYFIAIGFGCILIAAITPGFWLSTIKIPGAHLTATLAFTLYLTHKQMIHIAATVLGDFMARPVATVLLSLALIFLGASLVHFGIEKPFLRIRNRVLRKWES